MQIQNVAKQLQQLVAPGAAADPRESAAFLAEPAPAKESKASASSGPSFIETLAKYDVRSITPREFSALVNELHEHGHINSAELGDLSAIRLLLDQQGVDPDEPVDLVTVLTDAHQAREQQYEDILDAADSSTNPPPGRDEFLAAVRRQLDWIRKFAVANQEDVAAIDARA